MTDINLVAHAFSAPTPQFGRPAKALYATSRLWDAAIRQPPFAIHDHAAFVMGTRSYRPLPFDKFRLAIERLSALGAVEIRPSDLREWVETNTRLDSKDNFRQTYFLHGNVYMRFRKDSYGACTDEEAVHAFLMIGEPNALVQTAELIGLPHPLDDAKYPYRLMFNDSRPDTLPVLRYGK